jgi:hypothetical protein
MTKGTPREQYPSYCCSHCGEPVGWFGRLLDVFIGCGWRGCYWGK